MALFLKASSLYSLFHTSETFAQYCVYIVSASILFIVCGPYVKHLCWEIHHSADVATYWTLAIQAGQNVTTSCRVRLLVFIVKQIQHKQYLLGSVHAGFGLYGSKKNMESHQTYPLNGVSSHAIFQSSFVVKMQV